MQTGTARNSIASFESGEVERLDHSLFHEEYERKKNKKGIVLTECNLPI